MKILLSDFSIFVATIFKGIIVSSIFLSQNTSLNFASTFFHFKRPVFKSKSAKDKKFIEFQFNEGENFTQNFRSNGVDYSVRGNLTRNKNYNLPLIIGRNFGIGILCDIIFWSTR